jgi:hypothetical protein
MDAATISKTLVRNILEHAHDYPWRISDIGLLGLRLDEQRVFRLHVWYPEAGPVPGAVIHDHPFDFVSSVVAGQLTNTRYHLDASGVEYVRTRYEPGFEDDRTSDTVRLSGTAETYGEGDEYAQQAHELHDSRQLPGTVTVIRQTPTDVRRLTVCQAHDAPWVSGQARPATSDEVKHITATALECWF